MAANKLGRFLARLLTPMAWLLSALGLGPPPPEFEPPTVNPPRPPKD